MSTCLDPLDLAARLRAQAKVWAPYMGGKLYEQAASVLTEMAVAVDRLQAERDALNAALNDALDDADAMRAEGYPDPEWAGAARAVLAEFPT